MQRVPASPPPARAAASSLKGATGHSDGPGGSSGSCGRRRCRCAPGCRRCSGAAAGAAEAPKFKVPELPARGGWACRLPQTRAGGCVREKTPPLRPPETRFLRRHPGWGDQASSPRRRGNPESGLVTRARGSELSDARPLCGTGASQTAWRTGEGEAPHARFPQSPLPHTPVCCPATAGPPCAGGRGSLQPRGPSADAGLRTEGEERTGTRPCHWMLPPSP